MHQNRMSQSKIIFIVIVIILLAGNIFFASRFLVIRNELTLQRAEVAKVNFNSRIVDFASLFIEKVLKAGGEVSFEERLNLETAVRELRDEEILAQWNRFTGSK